MQARTLPVRSRRTRWATPLAWSLAGVAVLLQATHVMAAYAWVEPMDSVAEAVGGSVVLTATAAVGAAVASRVPTNPLGWLVVGTALFEPFIGLTESFLVLSERQVHAGRPMLPGTVAGLVLFNAGLGSILVVPVTFIPLLFPDGRLPSPRWRWVVWLAVAAIMLFAGTGAVASMRWPLQTLTTDGFSVPLLDVLARVGLALAVTAGALSISSLVVRWRRSRSVERQQLKWLIGGIAATLVGFIAEVDPVDTILMAVWSGLPDFLGDISGLALPVAIGVAVTRYRLYEIDRLVNRTVVYTIVTGFLLLVYLGLVGGLQLTLAPLASGSQLAVAASTLTVAVAFQPLRRVVQAMVDRRFNRPRYDAQRTFEAFQVSLRSEVDVDIVTHALREAASRTMEPTHVAVWLARRAP